MKSLILVGVFLTHSAFAQKKYSVEAIPADLKKGANVVVREKTEMFAIHSRNSATHKVHEVYTILNKEGKRFAIEVLVYSKLQKVGEFKGAVYDAAGEVIKRLRQDEIYDQSAISGFSLYEDNRLKAADLGQGSYPYTVEFNYEIEYKFLFYIPGFNLVTEDGVSVENSNYTLSSPMALKPRVKVLNTTQEPQVTMDKDRNYSWSWTFTNMAAMKKEPYGQELYEVVPRILAGPSEFEYEKYSGEMTSWPSFGKWINTLNLGRAEIPQATRDKIAELTTGLPLEEKIKKVYEHMQGRTRYVSIQIGIGGFQPFEASVVDETGYGDCKALSNYTVSLLKAAGVPANYVLIRAGKNAPPLETDFPSTQFNHAVVAVPRKSDTLWLECTSQTNPFGYMGTFTGDRKALMITADGASVVSTPRYPADKNIQSRSAEVFVDKTGNASAKVRTTYSGLQYENDGLQFVLNSRDEQKKWVEKNTHIPSFELGSFTVTNIKGIIPVASVKLDLSLRNYASVSGKRIFLNPNLMNRFSTLPERVESRKTKVVLDAGYVDMDTVVFQIPEDIYPEFVPAPVKLKSRFGEYQATYQFDQGKLIYVRRVRMEKGEFDPASYKEFMEFCQGINKADQVKIVFLGKT